MLSCMDRMPPLRVSLTVGSVAAIALLSSSASAQGAVSSDSISGYLDIRGGVADGDQTWLKGGYGKARYGGDRTGNTLGRLEVGEAGLVWHPRFSQLVGAVVHLEYEPGADHAIDIVESYLTFKTPPDAALRLSGRAGVFYPPVSLEHDRFAWTVDHSITPSAINTWIGEEIKVAGLEGTVRQSLGPGDLSFTASAFEADDTAGTLLAFRGWALHDQEATVFGSFPMPTDAPMRQSFFGYQDPFTRSMDEIDDRVGFYGQVAYTTDNGFSLSATHFDNAGNRLALDGKQWGWATRFTNFGASFKPAPQATVLAQYLTGETRTGWSMPQVVIDANFSAFYVLGAWDFGLAELTARYDDFRVDDQSFIAQDNENETGSAITLALGRQLTRHLLGRLELMQIDSDRPQRADAGLDPKDRQTVFQTSVRYDF
jgi:hypothetical protein